MSIKAVFRKLFLMPSDPDKEDEENLEHAAEEYAAIISSSKYADSNSDTAALEKLMAKLDMKGELEDGPQAVELPRQPSTQTSSGQEERTNNHDSDLQVNGVANLAQDEENKGASYKNRVSNHLKLMDEIEESSTVLPAQPVFQRAKFRKFNLPVYHVPKSIYECVAGNVSIAPNFMNSLQASNYAKKFQTLLWIEEAHQSVEMRRYDIEGTMLAHFARNDFLLTVPGLAEGRPSLLKGDRVILQSERRSTNYEGFISDVREHDVIVRLHESIHSLDGLLFDVRFMLSRTPFRRCHYGISQTRSILNTIFPVSKQQLAKPKLSNQRKEFPDSECINKLLNIYQRRAISNILSAECRPAPYIIFGPPGTGKTVTLIEAILQLYKLQPRYKILVCANSNSSVDLCASLLKESGVVPASSMVRVAAYYRVENQLIPPEIEEITLDMDGLQMHDYGEYRIVVTTCIQAGALYQYDQRFDYIFIDEAGHSSEPESTIALGLQKNDGLCVLAGDPHQLGPVCMSPLAMHNGLGKSLLERLYKQTVYQRRLVNEKMEYNEKYITKLRISYRCDPRILDISSRLFYDGDLKCQNKTPEYWLKLLNIETPVVFHTVKGRDRREYTNPSWFNCNEAIRCLVYVKRLYDAGLRHHQLGIITPYRRQIEKLNLLLDSTGLPRCKIATMEEFQGEEREVIIISTVRTREKKLEFDKKYNLGFLFNPKRFNVAVSRAKWLVIVVGDPAILCRDPHWKEYIESAHKFEDERDEKGAKLDTAT